MVVIWVVLEGVGVYNRRIKSATDDESITNWHLLVRSGHFTFNSTYQHPTDLQLHRRIEACQGRESDLSIETIYALRQFARDTSRGFKAYLGFPSRRMASAD